MPLYVLVVLYSFETVLPAWKTIKNIVKSCSVFAKSILVVNCRKLDQNLIKEFLAH